MPLKADLGEGGRGWGANKYFSLNIPKNEPSKIVILLYWRGGEGGVGDFCTS